jgi:3D (Asp-Asp-Asp) domain-containing protein
MIAARPPRSSNELMYDVWPTFVKPSSAPVDLPAPAPKPRVMEVYVTAYCACKKCCGSHAKGVTASGRPISYNGGHFIAADTSILPYGSRVIVPGYNDDNPVEVIDRGGAIKGAHIDIFMPTHEQAVEWGKKRLEITILK